MTNKKRYNIGLRARAKLLRGKTAEVLSTMAYLFMVVSVLLTVACAEEERPSAYQGTGMADLAFCVSTTRGTTTRMSDHSTQTDNNFRGIEEESLRLFPFSVQGEIGDGDVALSTSIVGMAPVDVTKHYFGNRGVKVPDETASFLCYAKATPETDKFANGAIEVTIPTTPNTSDILFTPEQIYKEKDGDKVKVDDKATAIAAYLTDIAKLLPPGSDVFRQFVNEGHLVACSSANVQKLSEWAAAKGADLSSLTSSYAPVYPASINLPEGAAAVKWNGASEAFEPQVMTTTEASINSLDRFVYPAELYYYANSRIKTSPVSLKEVYSNEQKWEDVLDEYETDNGIKDNSVHSIAIKDPLTYAVGCLQIGLVASNTLTDATGTTTITLGDNTFPLTAVFVSGQYAQRYSFTPKDDANEYIIYDKKVVDGISIGAAKTGTPTSATPTKHNSTLVLQSKDATNVRFALEFKNNSGNDFEGINGTIFKDTKFYLVGTIDVPRGETIDYKKRAFTKSYTTKGTVRITSLEEAYPYLPDLLDPRLEVGIKLITNWIQSTTTNVPL